MIDLTGAWHSSYEYGKGANNEPQASEHEIEFTRQGKAWTGKSLPNPEGSEVSLELTQSDNEFQGRWRERTSATGSYGGREFGGAVLFLLLNEGRELNGQWLGANSDNSRIKSGAWVLKRIQDDN